MADWSTTTKHEPSSINNGRRYELRDRVSIEQLNNMTENSFYAMEASSVAKEKAEQALEYAISGGSRVLENGEFVAEFNADTKADVKDFENYYTKSQVDSLISGGGDVDLSNYYTKEETYSQTEVNDLIDNVQVDLSDYYKKSETYSQTEVDNIVDTLENSLDNKANKSEIPDISGKADKSELENYVTTENLENRGYITEIPLEYVTETELNDKGYLTEVPSEYVTETELDAKGYATTSSLENGLSFKADQTSLDTTNSNVSTLQETVETLETDNSTNKTNIANIKSSLNATNTTISTMQTKLNGIEAGAEVNKVESVNGKIGAVVLSSTDVGALPNTTKYGASLDLSINTTDYKVTAQLKDQNGNNLGDAKTIDLPLESVVVNGRYDDATKKVVLTLQNDTEISFSVADLVSGLQTQITLSNKLASDLVSDTNQTNKFVTAGEKSTWNNKVDVNVDNLTNYYKKSETYSKTETGNLLDTALSTKADKSELESYVTTTGLETTLASKGYVTEENLDGYVTEVEHNTSVSNLDSLIRTEVAKKADISVVEELDSEIGNVAYNLSTVRSEYLKSVFVTNDGQTLQIYDQDNKATLFQGGGTNIIWREWT